MSYVKKHPAHRHLKKLQQIKRKHYHPLIHEIHTKHRISKKTLFYVKEYGPHSNVPKTILKESIGIVLAASIISSLGGLGIENIKAFFVTLVPIVILLPVLNDMIGGYGTILSSRFSLLLQEGKISERWWKNIAIRKLFLQILLVSCLTALMSATMALVISSFYIFSIDVSVVARVFVVVMIDVLILVSTLFLVAVLAGMYFFRKGEDPNNFLIPITTAVADFGNMIILSVLILLFF
jgi:cation transporter-like permease